MTPRGYFKRPGDTLRLQFDFRDFALEVAPATATFALRAEGGLLVDADSSVDGLIDVTVTGGVLGRQYEIGVEAITSNGRSLVQRVIVRLRELPGWALVPDLGGIGSLWLHHDGVRLFLDGVPLGLASPQRLHLDGLVLAHDGQAIYFS